MKIKLKIHCWPKHVYEYVIVFFIGRTDVDLLVRWYEMIVGWGQFDLDGFYI